jgi:hypothetical protein
MPAITGKIFLQTLIRMFPHVTICCVVIKNYHYIYINCGNFI